MIKEKNQPNLLTIEETAKYLHVSLGTVRNLIDRGNLVAVRMCDRVVRIPQSDIDNFIRAARDDFRQG